MTSRYCLMCYGYMICYYFRDGFVLTERSIIKDRVHDRMYYTDYLKSKAQLTFGRFQLLNWKYLKFH